jgi:predicted AlkP superfamily phosphohydrolase/phosphomutase
VSLLQNAGQIVGIGDFRQEKGRGGYGTFSVAGSEDMGDMQEIWDEITQEGRDIQEAAMNEPECFDDQTAELMEFLQEERLRRAA